MTSSGWRTATGDADAPPRPVWLGLGSNLGDRAANLAAAVAALARHLDIDALSGVWETEPFGYADQPVFWNMAVRARTTLSPQALLALVKQLEPELGRVASFRMGPRGIDIDVLLHDDIILQSDALVLPHPGLRDRMFVLRPLLELDPGLCHPATGERLADRAAALDGSGVRHIGAAADVLPLDGMELRED